MPAFQCNPNVIGLLVFQMLLLLEEMYRQLGLVQALKIPKDKLKRFLVILGS